MVKRYIWVISLLLFIAVIVIVADEATPSVSTNVLSLDSSILIDPGHGGEDGGASASDGTLEKNINLAIGLQVHDLFYVFGFHASMTRNTDISIHDPSSGSTRAMKLSDMRNRLAAYERSDVIISIHQNHFSIPKYSGAQVFYSQSNAYSKQLALSVQQSVVEHVQPENTRLIKQAGDGIYLLHHTTQPAILVECGFLSNENERDMLKKTDYQQQIAMAIFDGYISAQGEGSDDSDAA